MHVAEREEVRQMLHSCDHAVADHLHRALAPTGAVELSAQEVTERLAAIVDQVIELLLAERFDPREGQTLGADLARPYYAHPNALSRTQHVLAVELLQGLSPEQRIELHPRLMEVVSELAAGFLRESRRTLLAEQKSIRGALLTARQQVQDALHASEARFRAVFEEAAIGMSIGDVDGRILDINRALQTMLGYSADEMRRMNVSQLTHPDDAASVWELYLGLIEGKHDSFRTEKRYFRKDGGTIWCHLTVSLGRTAEGVPQFQIAMLENITERKRAEEALQQSEARFGSLVQHASDIIIVVDADGTRKYISPSVEHVLGYRPEELIGSKLSEVRHPDDEKRAHDFFEDVVAHPGQHRVAEYRVGRRDGSWGWFEITATNLLADPNVGGIVVNARDTTDRKQAEEALRQSEARFSSLIRNALDIVTILDADGTVRYESPAIERIFGYQQQELIGRNAFELVNPDDAPPTYAAFLTMLDDPTLTPTVEFRFRHKDGSWRWLEATGTNLLTDPAVGGIVVNSRDVTERKAAEGALRRSEAGLAEAQRLACLGSWEWHIATNHSTWSAGMHHLMGTTPERLSPSYEGFIERVHPDDRARVQAIVGEASVNHTDAAFECRMLRNAETEHILYSMTTPLFDAEGRFSGFRGTVQDISDRKRLEADLRHQAFHDSLTGLPNRRGFITRLDDALRTAIQRTQEVAVLFLDLDRFKVVNDSLGHMSGDQMLGAVAARLTALLRDADTLARFGGDEFAVLLTGDLLPDEAEWVAHRILAAFDSPFIVDGRELFITGSIGIVLSSTAPGGAMDLLQAADIAMYRAKATGPGGYAVFDPCMYASAVERLELETDLQRAVEQNELVLHYQPKIELKSGRMVAVEALIRWQHPTRGLLMPNDFLPLAEETGLIVPMGRWVLEEACRQAVAWRATVDGYAEALMCVNLSAREFRQHDLAAQMTRILAETGLPSTLLELEISEQVLLDDDGALASLVNLRALGVRLALDDFGTGHSALSSLRRLPIETLKIDRSFIQDMATDRKTRAVVQAVTSLAHELDMLVVAEGVETESHLEAVRGHGIDIVQGAYFAPALPAVEFANLLAMGGTKVI